MSWRDRLFRRKGKNSDIEEVRGTKTPNAEKALENILGSEGGRIKDIERRFEQEDRDEAKAIEKIQKEEIEPVIERISEGEKKVSEWGTEEDVQNYIKHSKEKIPVVPVENFTKKISAEERAEDEKFVEKEREEAFKNIGTFFENTENEARPTTAIVPSSKTRCIKCGKLINKDDDYCMHCGASQRGGAKPKEEKKEEAKEKTFCLGCRQLYDADKEKCPNCGLPNSKYVSPHDICPSCGKNPIAPGKAVCNNCYKAGNYASRKVSRGEAFEKIGKRLKNRWIEILMFWIAGAAITILTGGTFTYLAAALIVYSFEIFIPTEHDVLNKVKLGEYLDLQEHIGPLFLRAMIKFIFYFLVIFQFFMINQPVPALIATFVAYFSMPTAYKTSRPYKGIEAWVRVGFGVLLAVEMYVTFSLQNPIILTNPLLIFNIFLNIILNPFAAAMSPASTLALLTVAFFVTLPKRIRDDDAHMQINIGIGKSAAKAFNSATEGPSKFIGNMLFLFFALIAGYPVIFWFGGVWSSFQTVYIIIWLFSVIGGYFAGPDGRPYVGIIIIAFSLFAFTVSLPGFIGQAIFGIWWPQVEGVLTPIGNAFAPMWSQVGKGMSDAWLLLTNPALYYQKNDGIKPSKPKRSDNGRVIYID